MAGGLTVKTANDWLDAIKAQHGFTSDYALAKALGVPQAQVIHYRKGRRAFDAMMAVKVAELLGVEPINVIASAEHERARTDERKQFWRRFAACFLLGAAVNLMAPAPAGASLHNRSSGASAASQEYALCARRRRAWRDMIAQLLGSVKLFTISL